MSISNFKNQTFAPHFFPLECSQFFRTTCVNTTFIMAPPSKPTTRASLGSNKDDDDGSKKPAASPTKPAPPSTANKITKKTSTTPKGKSSDKIPRKPAASPAKHQLGGTPSTTLFHPSPPRHGTSPSGVAALSPFSFGSPGASTSSSGASSPGAMSASSASTGNLANLFGGATGAATLGGTTDLASFGIIPAASTNGVSNNGENKTCLLKCAVVRDGDSPAIYYYFLPATGRPEDAPGVWPEKVLVDKLRSRDPSVMMLNFDPHVRKLFLNNEPVKNSKNYMYRLVRIRLAAPVPNGNARNLGQHICTLLNASPDNDVTVVIVDDSFFLHEAGSTHSDVLGLEEGFKDLLRSTTGQQPGPGFYEAHRGAIHSYFRAGQFSLELARALHAPLDEVHPNQRAALVPPAAAAAAEQPDDDGGDNGGVEVETVLHDTDDDEDGLDLSDD